MEDHVTKQERVVDIVVSMENLRYYVKNGRLEGIPKKTPKGAIYRHTNDLKILPSLPAPKSLHSDRTQWPLHIQTFWTQFTSIAPELKKVFGKKWDPALATGNVRDRSSNLKDSGHVSLLTVGMDPDNPQGVIVVAKVYPAMKGGHYITALRMSLGNALLASACSCTNG